MYFWICNLFIFWYIYYLNFYFFISRKLQTPTGHRWAPHEFSLLGVQKLNVNFNKYLFNGKFDEKTSYLQRPFSSSH